MNEKWHSGLSRAKVDNRNAARAMTNSDMPTINPVRSASSMNSPGAKMPRSGWAQRIKISPPTHAPVDMFMIG